MAPLTKTILITSLLTSLTPFLTSASTINFPRAIDGGCIGDKGAPGVCVSTTNCKNAGGKPIDNACPKDGPDIKCCTKPSCGTGGKGNCRFTSSCDSGVTEFNKCPGPTAFRCCMPKGSGSSDPPPPSGGGDGDQPELPSTDSKCKSVAIAGAKKIIEQFPGVVTSIGCIRTTEKCKTDPSSSEHCTGMATDMMLPVGVPRFQVSLFYQWLIRNQSTAPIPAG